MNPPSLMTDGWLLIPVFGMLAPTHATFGIFLSLIVLAIFGIKASLHWTVLLFAIFGALLPDIDIPKSVLGRLVPFISKPLERHFGHRTITHSFVGLFLATLIIAPVTFVLQLFIPVYSHFGARWVAAFFIGYLSHLIIDMFNKRGCQLLWPEKSRDVVIKNPRLRSESGAPSEIAVFTILLFLIILALPLSKYGLTSSLRWMLGTTRSAIEEFKEAQNITYLDFSGRWNTTKKPIKTRAEILDFEKGRLVVYIPPGVYSVSDELASDITAHKMRVAYTKTPLRIEQKTIQVSSWNAFLDALPPNALISGTIKLPIELNIPQSIQGAAGRQTITQTGDTLKLYFSTKTQIGKLTPTNAVSFEEEKLSAKVSQLKARLTTLRAQIKKEEHPGGLTAEGANILLTPEERELAKAKLETLRAEEREVEIALKEAQQKIAQSPHLFSGTITIRYFK